MATSNRSKSVRFRYGKCLNESCSKGKAKEVQQISAHKDFVCAECGKSLLDCPPPKSWWEKNGKKTIIAAVAVAVVGAGVGISIGGGDEAAENEQAVILATPADSAKNDTAQVIADAKPAEADSKAVEETQKPEQKETAAGKETVGKPAARQSAPKHAPGERYQGTLNLGYGTYSGEIVDGRPDGTGVLRYNTSQRVVSTKDVMAESGERIEGVFDNGKPSFVTLYKNDGNTVKVHR